MELSNEFEVQVPIDEAWAVLTDVEAIAPCLPGAQLEEVVTDPDGRQEFRGVVKVKVGPITAHYKGAARFSSKDDASYTAVLSASGRDSRGQGHATAAITAVLIARGDRRTAVSVQTDLALTGKVAQFGRGVLADVSKKLLDQFVDNLEATVLVAGSVDIDQPGIATATAEATPTVPSEIADLDHCADGQPSVHAVDGPEADAVDLLDAAGSPILKRALPLAGLALVVAVVVGLVRRRGRG